MENIIACGKFPVVVDLETLLQQRNKGPYDDKFFVRQAKKWFVIMWEELHCFQQIIMVQVQNWI